MSKDDDVVVIKKTVKPVGNTAHVLVPKKYVGKRAIIIIPPQNNSERDAYDNCR